MNRESLNEQMTLMDACQVLKQSYTRGWISTRDGNVSVRSSPHSFLISPSGARKFSLLPSDFLEVQIAPLVPGQPDDPMTRASPSGELELHRLVQELMPASGRVVLHLHPTYILSAMYAGYELASLARQFPEVSRYTRIGPNVPALPATSSELAVATANAFRDTSSDIPQVVGLERHGIVSIGRDAWECFEHVERLEHVCQIVMSASARTGRR